MTTTLTTPDLVATADDSVTVLPADDGFILSASEDDAPAAVIFTAGATSDPVKDYLKAIGRVRLLTAEEEVTIALRIEAGLFADHLLQSAAVHKGAS